MEAFLLGLIAAILASGPTNTPVVPPQQAQQATQHKLLKLVNLSLLLQIVLYMNPHFA